MSYTSERASTAGEDRTVLVCSVGVSAPPAIQLAWLPSQLGGRPLLVSEEQWEGQETPVSSLQVKAIELTKQCFSLTQSPSK